MPVTYDHVSCEIVLTGKCNMRCDYCIAKSLPGSTMTDETGRKVIDLFVHLAQGAKDVEFTFTGGEPLLAFAVLKSVVRYAVQRTRDMEMEARFVLKTNGTRLDDEMIAFLETHRVKVVVSVDGQPAVHDKHRRLRNGTKTHATICRNLSALLHKGIPCVASMTVHPDSVPMIGEGVRFLHGLGVEQIDVGPVYDTAEWTPEQCGDWVQSLMEAAEYVRGVQDSGGNLEVGPFFRDSDHRDGVLSDRWGCHAAASNLAFLPTGEVAGCSALGMMHGRFPELVLGNVDDGITQQAVDRLVGLAQASREERKACRGCPTATNCTGGCLAINLGTTGMPFDPPHFYCSTIAAIPMAWEKAWTA